MTETDLKSEKTIKAIIRSFYKDHTILAEETGQDTNFLIFFGSLIPWMAPRILYMDTLCLPFL
ncbi:hypothetical protein Ct9H90mP29_22960 [bacterium]|nr:MAG: hypothetical protein Ct9H90mP29_22960 [bacterium]